MIQENYDRQAAVQGLLDRGYTVDDVKRKASELGLADNSNLASILQEVQQAQGGAEPTEPEPEPIVVPEPVQSDVEPEPDEVPEVDPTGNRTVNVPSTFGQAAMEFSTSRSIASALAIATHPADPEFRMDSDEAQAKLKEYGLDWDHTAMFESRSMQELDERLWQHKRRTETVQGMIDRGESPLLAALAGNIADPANWAMAGAEVGAIMKLAKTAREARLVGAVTGAGLGAGTVGLDDYASPNVTASDYVVGTVLGALGGGIGASHFATPRDVVQSVTESAYPKPRMQYTGIDPKTGKPKYRMSQPAKPIPSMDDAKSTSTAQDGSTYTELTPKSAVEFVNANAPAKREGAIGKLTGVLSGAVKFGTSDNKSIRGASAMLFENPQGATQNGTAAAHAAKFNLQLNMHVQDLYKHRAAWLKSQNKGVKGRFFSQSTDAEMWKAIEAARDHAFITGKYSAATDPSILAMAKKVDDFYSTALQQSREAGVRGAEVEYRTGWSPRRWDFGKMRTAGRDTFVQEISRGIRMAQPEMDTKLSKSIAGQIYNKALDKAKGGDDFVHFNKMDAFDELDYNKLKDLGVDKSVLDEFEAYTKARAAGESEGRTAQRLRSRIDIAQASVRPFIADANLQQMGKYMRDSVGDSSLAMVGIKDRRDLDNLFTGMRRDAVEKGLPIQELDEFEDMVRSAFTSMPPKNAASKGVSVGKSYLRAMALGGMGFAQLTEAGRVSMLSLAQGVMKGMPEALGGLGRMVKLGKTEKSNLLKELEGMFNFRSGEEHQLMSGRLFLDERDPHKSAFMQRLGTIGAGMNELNGYLSLYNTLRSRMQNEAWTAVTRKMVRGALGKENIPEARLMDFGIDQDLWAKVQRQMQQAGSSEDALNIANWDRAVADEFFMAVHRGVDAAVQTARKGEDAYWMSNGLAGILTMFLNYPMLAMNKQLFRNIKHGDAEAAGGVLADLVIAGSAVYARTAVQTIGTDSMEEKLTDPKMAMNVLTMMPSMGLTGNAAQLLGGILGVDGMTYGGRYGGVSDSFLASVSPGVGMLERVTAGVTSPLRMVGKGEATRADIGALMSITPGNNLPVLSTIKNNILEGLK